MGPTKIRLLPYFGVGGAYFIMIHWGQKRPHFMYDYIGDRKSHVKLSLIALPPWPHVKVSCSKGVWKSQCLRIGWKFQDLLIRPMLISTKFFGAQLCLVLKQWPSENFGVNFWILLHYQESFYAKLTPC